MYRKLPQLLRTEFSCVLFGKVSQIILCVTAACNSSPGSFDRPASDSRLRIRRGGYGSPDGDRLPLVYGAGYDLLHREVAGLSRLLLVTIRLSDSTVRSTLTK